jgi:multiple sugar transport system substrate-binding protein
MEEAHMARASARAGRARAQRKRIAAGATVAAMSAALVACGGEGGPPVLTWYTNPDSGGQAEIAKRCTEAANGEYTITTAGLPTDATQQREQLIRRLAGGDSSVTLMSLDPPFVPEFAQAGFLYEIPQDRASEFTDGVVESAVESATWQDQLVVAPFWANTQLLWYRKSVVEQAGLDPEQITWEQMIQAAEAQNKTIAVQGNRYEGYTVWINALIESAGGQVLENPEASPEDLKLGLDSAAGESAAQVINQVAQVAGPAVSTADEEAARRLFQGENGGFMVNWPYVWAAWAGEVEAGTLEQSVVDDIAWAVYPRVNPDEEAAPPFGGIHIGIGAYTDQPEFALEAVECITSEENQKYYMLSNGNPAALSSVYEDPEVREAYPMADTIVQSLEQAAPRPLTPYYAEVSSSLQREFHPPASVNAQTPGQAADLIQQVINGEVLL